jgi:hypothetical protein
MTNKTQDEDDEDGLEMSLVGPNRLVSQRRTSSNGWDSESTVHLIVSVCCSLVVVLFVLSNLYRLQLISKEDVWNCFVCHKRMILGSR